MIFEEEIDLKGKNEKTELNIEWEDHRRRSGSASGELGEEEG